MNHIFVTTNHVDSVTAMLNYSGTKLIHTEDGYTFWYCRDLAQEDIDKIHGYGVPQEVKLVGMLLLNKPQQPTITPTIGAVDAIQL